MTLFPQDIPALPDDWTFRDSNTRYFTHCYHDYPARMIPQIADKLIGMYGRDSGTLFDPYCGTGTTLVEGLLHGYQTVGTDLNPLARLIAKAKTAYIDPGILDGTIKRFLEFAMARPTEDLGLPSWLDPERVAFWFKPHVTRQLRSVYHFLSQIRDKATECFFLVAFSETIRECSNTRASEFKLFRKDQNALDLFNPDVFQVMVDKLGRNRVGYADMLGFMGQREHWKETHVHDFNTVVGLPQELLPHGIDFVITSPPYGDSHTTVAYGQYSRLSSEWLNFVEAPRVDASLMGGKRLRHLPTFGCGPLDTSIGKIAAEDASRAREVAAFYVDLEASIRNVARVLNDNAHVCYVVANRRVKGEQLPTDDAVAFFFEKSGCTHVAMHYRDIPNKRMPVKNSPSNKPGEKDFTMSREIIVVCRKR